MRIPVYGCLAFLLLGANISYAQTGTDTTKTSSNSLTENPVSQRVSTEDESHPLKTTDLWLPKWAVDLNFRAGKLNQDIQLIDLSKSYRETYTNNSLKFSDHHPSFENGTAIGGDIALNYFFSPNRRWGVSVGAMFIHYTGDMTIDAFEIDYKAVIPSGRPEAGKEFRQLIQSDGPIQEAIKVNNINIPVLLKYKWSFAKKGERPGFGLNIEAGPVLGVQSTTRTIASAQFDYEAVYSLDPNSKNSSIFEYDNSILSGTAGDPGKSLILTEKFVDLHRVNDVSTPAAFDLARSGPGQYNVGLNKTILPGMRPQTSNFNKVSFGAMLQAGVSYQFSYNIAFLVNGYFMYQKWRNDNGNNNYRMTEFVIPSENNEGYFGNYESMTKGIRYADYMSYGMTAGFRIFFGERPDRDADGIVDVLDCDMNKWGPPELGGCPDRDNDGVSDALDRCADKYGLAEFDGCPDTDNDGFPDNIDKCIHEPGILRGCPVSPKSGPVVDSYKTVSGALLPPHVVLETNVLYFEFGQSAITDSAAAVLEYAKGILEKEPKVVIYISGHTDDIGNDKNNLYLSYQRANAARNYLINQGIAPQRVIIGSYGKENPVNPNDSPENRARNRRIELQLLLPLK